MYKTYIHNSGNRKNKERSNDNEPKEKKEWLSLRMNEIESIRKQINSVIDVTNELDQKKKYTREVADSNKMQRSKNRIESVHEKIIRPIVINHPKKHRKNTV